MSRRRLARSFTRHCHSKGARIAMPSPVYSAGTPGNLIGGVSVAKQTTVAAFLDLSSSIEGQVSCEVTTGASAPTAGTAFSAYKAYAAGAAAPIAVSSNANSHHAGRVEHDRAARRPGRSAMQQAGGSKLGEVATISAISGTTLNGRRADQHLCERRQHLPHRPDRDVLRDAGQFGGDVGDPTRITRPPCSSGPVSGSSRPTTPTRRRPSPSR